MFRVGRCFLVLRPKGMEHVLYLTDSARYKIVPRYLKAGENCWYVLRWTVILDMTCFLSYIYFIRHFSCWPYFCLRRMVIIESM
jgi:hypothetical protein